MDKDLKKELAGFEEVWRRVEQGKKPPAAEVKLMPRREAKSAAVRFTKPPR